MNFDYIEMKFIDIPGKLTPATELYSRPKIQ